MGAEYRHSLREHMALCQRLLELDTLMDAAADACESSLRQGGKLMLCGNGGSAADSLHLASEFTGRLRGERRPLAALALTADVAALTSLGNDYGFDAIFMRQIEALGRAGDTLILISTSGQSPNLLRAAKQAKAQGITTLGLLGRDGGHLKALCDLSLIVPSHDTARIQEAQLLMGHALCATLEQRLGLMPAREER